MARFLTGSNGDSIAASAISKPNVVVIADSNGMVTDWLPQWTYIHAISTLTTSSTSDVTIADMVVVPGAGTYEVEFYCNAGNSTNSDTVVASFYIGGVQFTNSVRTITTGAANRSVHLLAANITFDGTQLLEVKWSVNAGTATVINRTLRLKLVG